MCDDFDFDDIEMQDDPAEFAEVDIQAELEELESNWLLDKSEELIDKLNTLFYWGEPSFSPQEAALLYESASQSISQIHASVLKNDTHNLLPRVERVVQSIGEAYHLLTALAGWTHHDSHMPMTASDALLRFSLSSIEKDTTQQVVYLFILERCYRLKLRHRGDVVYKQIFNNGVPTRAWVPATDINGTGFDVDSVENLVHYICQRSNSYSIFKLWITTNTNSVCEKLEHCLEPEFPLLRTSREWMSFADGIYSLNHDCFVPYSDKSVVLPPELATCTYIPVHFGQFYFRTKGVSLKCLPLHPLMEVKTPLFDSILDAQNLCGHTKFWLMALLGRALFWDGVLDTWQVVLFIKGRAGTGKSTLLRLVADIYKLKDVVIISNNTEGTFGMMSLTPETLLWMAPEVKEDFNLEQAQFQSLGSHETLSIPRKNKKPLDCRILCQGLMAGNTFPTKWKDNAASIRRRLFVINFSNEVKNTVTNLLERMKVEEIGGIIRKIVWCYKHAAVLVGDKDIWKSGILSKHILDQNELLYASTNPLRNFLTQCNEIEKKAPTAANGPFNWCPKEDFLACLKEYLSENALARSPFVEDYYNSVFSDFGMSIQKAEYTWGSDPARMGWIVVGACPVTLKDKMVTLEDRPNPYIGESSAAAEVDLYEVSQEDFDEM